MAPPSFLSATWRGDGILEIRYNAPCVLVEEMAAETIRWLDAVLADHPGTLAILVDAANVKDATAECTIDVERAPGKGTTFRIRIPRSASPSSDGTGQREGI